MCGLISRIKITFCIFFLFLLALSFASGVHAINFTAGPVIVAAEIPSGLALKLTVVDQLTGSAVPSLDFGILARSENDYRAERFFNVLLNVNTAGSAYELTQISTPLTRTGGSETIPSGAFFVKPIYESEDNAGLSLPLGANLGVAGSAVGSRLLFSDPTGSARSFRSRYTLSGDPITGATETIPLSQKSGAYAATVQFTLTVT
jgi:hypothetical protein